MYVCNVTEVNRRDKVIGIIEGYEGWAGEWDGCSV